MAVAFVLLAEPLVGPMEYALMIGQPKPMVITEHVVVPIGMVEMLVNAG